jgi:5-methylcytosine-specific restriction protein A
VTPIAIEVARGATGLGACRCARLGAGSRVGTRPSSARRAGERGRHRCLAEEQGMALVRFCLHCNTHHPGRCPRLEQRRGSSTQRGYDSRWRRLAADAIHRHPYCTICDSTVDLTADHIVPLSQGGTNTMSNIRVLCRSCNSRKGGRGWCSIEGRRLKDPAPGFRERNSKKRGRDLKIELKSGSDDG